MKDTAKSIEELIEDRKRVMVFQIGALGRTSPTTKQSLLILYKVRNSYYAKSNAS